MTVFSASSLAQHSSILSASPSNHGIKLFGKSIPAPTLAENAAQPAEIKDEFRGVCDEPGFSPRGVHDELGVSWGSGSEDEDFTGISLIEKREPSEVRGSREKPSESSKPLSPTLEAKLKALQGVKNPVRCPRCESLDTKFCYFNNYNVKQPRHYCKHCQRYWTAGGTLRNVPVGAGKRKCRHPSTQQRPTFTLQSVVYRGDDPGTAESLLSYCTSQQVTKMNPSLQSAAQNTTREGDDSRFSYGNVSSQWPSLVCMSSKGSTTASERVQTREIVLTDFQSPPRDSNAEHSSNTSLNANTTECPELSLCSSSAPALSIQNATFERSTFHQNQPSSTPPENTANAKILPVLAEPWPFLYQMFSTQIPLHIPSSSVPLYPTAGDALPYRWPHFPGSVWTTVAPAIAHSLGIPTSLGKRPAQEAAEDSSLSSLKASRINASEPAASSSSCVTLDTVERSET